MNNSNSVCSILEVIFSGLLFLTTGAALIVASRAYKISKASEWREFSNSYFKEYRTREMGLAVAKLYSLQKDSKKDVAALVSSYILEYQQLTKLHIETRRMVSSFYQEISILSMRIKAVRKIAYKYWTKDDLSIIPEILLPIETIAIPLAMFDKTPSKTEIYKYVSERTVNNEIVFNQGWPPAFKAMYKFWENANQPS